MAAEAIAVDAAKAAALLETMRAAGAAESGSVVTYLEQLEGGWSRHSYAARVTHPDRGGAGDPDGERAYIVRARPRGSLLDTDLGEEFRVFSLLQRESPPTPAVRGFEPSEQTPFDGPFFVMDRLGGRAPNVWRRPERDELAADWASSRGIAHDLVAHLAAIHAIDAGRAAAAATARDFQRTVDRWQDVYEQMKLVRDPVVDEAYAWVRSREPDPVAPCLVHGDYRIGNCLIDGGRVSGILDWELCSFGDPRFDLGYMALDYHAGKFTTPGSSLLNAVAERDWFHERYALLSGRPVDPEVVRTFTALGALMLFAIMTTGIRVYADARTRDVRMAWGRFVLPGLRQDLTALMGW
ncbi:phosphotransferase family protein [Conexibacter sp. JD483]|uniref:phosphotransferase family protein n=1 Tax=unclassified Conexibacter TaxID=2627773 RepID=UPI00271AE58E|nr:MULTISPECIES: phosphotransferase family protein [unclassified Conexibacter]MDO8187801.1 phosphotransferase family protein [Conexibacter sp. CPCC 205706]MDO8199990.1 phosphotransferase family protein [Conexibacter sp. CPCC 205762]MDR9369517.1 phosphotransferase family protein [Conexibacter sp. JD483]